MYYNYIMINFDTLMTIEDVARYLKVRKRTIYEWLRLKKIPASKVIGQWRFRRDRIDKWLDTASK